VISDCFAFAIRVRRQVDLVRLGGSPLQQRYNFFLAWRHDQRRLKRAVLQFHTDVVLGQIHDVADRSQDLEPLA